jgi:sec-independent protein translocase protein TatA
MFGSIGFQEIVIILSIALLVFGPKKLPEVGKSLGKALREFRKTSDEIKEKIEEEIQAEEFREIKREITETVDITGSITSQDNNPYDLPDPTRDEAPPEEAGTAKETEPDEEGKKIT